MYVGLIFFLIGIYLSIFQVELFTAFLWLIECSVLFVYLLLLFFLNIKGIYNYTYTQTYYICIIFCFIFFCVFFDTTTYRTCIVDLFNILENYYESVCNFNCNDLFGFAISYYTLNIVEFLIIGFLLLVGSVICVNLYQINKNVRAQSYFNYLVVFNFFTDFLGFYFLRRQSITKQGNTKTALKIFKKK